jgi:hypothetical protein
MVFKELKLEGFGKILTQPINIKECEMETTDNQGRPIITSRVGAGYKTVNKNVDGVELPNNQLCKKLNVDGEDLILPKFEATKEVAKDDIFVSDDPGLLYTGIDRKFYTVSCDDNPGLKKLVIDDNKSLIFPYTNGNGWKLWEATLTNWHGKMLMVICRGDLNKELDKYDEETVEIEIEVVPKPEMKKLIKVLAMH